MRIFVISGFYQQKNKSKCMNNRENVSDPGKVKKAENIKSKTNIKHKTKLGENTSKIIISIYIN